MVVPTKESLQAALFSSCFHLSNFRECVARAATINENICVITSAYIEDCAELGYSPIYSSRIGGVPDFQSLEEPYSIPEGREILELRES